MNFLTYPISDDNLDKMKSIIKDIFLNNGDCENTEPLEGNYFQGHSPLFTIKMDENLNIQTERHSRSFFAHAAVRLQTKLSEEEYNLKINDFTDVINGYSIKVEYIDNHQDFDIPTRVMRCLVLLKK